MSRIFASVTAAALLVLFCLSVSGWAQNSTKQPSGSAGSGKSANGEKASSGQAAPNSASKPSSSVRVDKCTIKLIDDVQLATERTGIIKTIHVKEGSVVKAGDTLIELKDEVARAAHARAEKEASNDIEVRYAKKAHEFSLAELEVALDTNRRVPGAVPLIEIKKLQLGAERAKLQIENAEFQFDINKLKRDETQAMLDIYVIKAPFGGRVNKVHKHEGEAVREGEAAPILDLVDTSKVYVEGNVPVRDIWAIQASATVRVSLDFPDADLPQEKETFEGRIISIDAKVLIDKVRVRAEVVNRDDILKSGLYATMIIETGRRAGADTAEKPAGKASK
jgi:multidrug efflux pump subunit AcrA (membrane-fusion protein)